MAGKIDLSCTLFIGASPVDEWKMEGDFGGKLVSQK